MARAAGPTARRRAGDRVIYAEDAGRPACLQEQGASGAHRDSQRYDQQGARRGVARSDPGGR
eukprot:6982967-Prymnesium_polylepis.1